LQRREAASCVATVPIYEADASSSSASSSADDAGSSSATSLCSELDGLFEVPAAAALGMGNGMFDFEFGLSGEMDLGSYYADLAEGMLLEPPRQEFAEVCWDGGADYAALWSYN
jgi:hypothetical protein